MRLGRAGDRNEFRGTTEGVEPEAGAVDDLAELGVGPKRTEGRSPEIGTTGVLRAAGDFVPEHVGDRGGRRLAGEDLERARLLGGGRTAGLIAIVAGAADDRIQRTRRVRGGELRVPRFGERVALLELAGDHVEAIEDAVNTTGLRRVRRDRLLLPTVPTERAEDDLLQLGLGEGALGLVDRVGLVVTTLHLPVEVPQVLGLQRHECDEHRFDSVERSHCCFGSFPGYCQIVTNWSGMVDGYWGEV